MTGGGATKDWKSVAVSDAKTVVSGTDFFLVQTKDGSVWKIVVEAGNIGDKSTPVKVVSGDDAVVSMTAGRSHFAVRCSMPFAFISLLLWLLLLHYCTVALLCVLVILHVQLCTCGLFVQLTVRFPASHPKLLHASGKVSVGGDNSAKQLGIEEDKTELVTLPDVIAQKVRRDTSFTITQHGRL